MPGKGLCAVGQEHVRFYGAGNLGEGTGGDQLICHAALEAREVFAEPQPQHQRQNRVSFSACLAPLANECVLFFSFFSL